MYKCKCCNHETLSVPPKDAVGFVCPICWWENDVFATDDDEPSDENHGLTLNQGRKNYRDHGICDLSLKDPNGRTPKKHSIPESTASVQIIGGSCHDRPNAANQSGEQK